MDDRDRISSVSGTIGIPIFGEKHNLTDCIDPGTEASSPGCRDIPQSSNRPKTGPNPPPGRSRHNRIGNRQAACTYFFLFEELSENSNQPSTTKPIATPVMASQVPILSINVSPFRPVAVHRLLPCRGAAPSPRRPSPQDAPSLPLPGVRSVCP